jgi:hypothetical protein
MFGVTMDLRISPTHPDDAVTRDGEVPDDGVPPDTLRALIAPKFEEG